MTAPTRTEDGFTLVELLMIIVLGGIVGAIATAASIGVLSYQRTVEARSNAQQQLQLAADQFASQVRSGNVAKAPSADGTTVTLYTQAGGNPICALWQYRANVGELWFRSWDPAWQANGDRGQYRRVATGLTNAAENVPVIRAPGWAQAGANLDINLRARSGDGQSLAVSTSATGRNSVFGYQDGLCNTAPPDGG